MRTEYALDKPTIERLPTRPEDLRLGHLVQRGVEALDAPGVRCVIVGFPSDEGVRLNGGRAGARRGPEMIRPWLYRLTPDARNAEGFIDLCHAIVDVGDVRCTGDVATDQAALGRLVGDLLERGFLPIILGGGHETSYGHFLGYVRNRLPIRVVNLDAHTNVRPLRDGQPHSGSPFRQMHDHPGNYLQHYAVAGVHAHTAATARIRYITDRGGQVIWRDATHAAALRPLYDHAGPLLASFDLDAVDQMAAPGVSAANAEGLDRALWLAACEMAGRSPGVTSFDLVEFNPVYDLDHRTARLAALGVWRFLQGLALRMQDVY